MNQSIKKLAFLDRFYKKFCCGAKNHPGGWRKEKRINAKATRRKLKDMTERDFEDFLQWCQGRYGFDDETGEMYDSEYGEEWSLSEIIAEYKREREEEQV